jgi:hypothetical protein
MELTASKGNMFKPPAPMDGVNEKPFTGASIMAM